MDFKALKWQMIRRALARRLILGSLCFVLAMVIVSSTRMAYEIRTNEPIAVNFEKCSLDIGSITNPHMKKPYVGGKNLTVNVIEELRNKEMLSLDARSICLGEGSDSDALTMRELGFTDVFVVHRNPIASLLQKQEHELDFHGSTFDFVLCRNFNRIPIPALLVLEIERVLRPGGIGAMLLGFSGFHMGSLVRSATPVSLLLRNSDILHVCGVGSSVLIVFKKRLDNVAHFKDYRLPDECPSISRNKPFMQHIEPLEDHKLGLFENKVSYLPRFMNVSSRNRLIYINMGMDEFEPSYPIHPQAFNMFVVDHNVSSLSHVKKPGVTFVYHPGLVEEDGELAPSLNHGDYLEAPLHEHPFEFIKWFKETAKDGDFVVLKMNASVTQLKALFELFESGAICHVDELFIRCSEGVHCRNSRCNSCLSLFNGLRDAGVFVHRRSGI